MTSSNKSKDIKFCQSQIQESLSDFNSSITIKEILRKSEKLNLRNEFPSNRSEIERTLLVRGVLKNNSYLENILIELVKYDSKIEVLGYIDNENIYFFLFSNKEKLIKACFYADSLILSKLYLPNIIIRYELLTDYLKLKEKLIIYQSFGIYTEKKKLEYEDENECNQLSNVNRRISNLKGKFYKKRISICYQVFKYFKKFFN